MRLGSRASVWLTVDPGPLRARGASQSVGFLSLQRKISFSLRDTVCAHEIMDIFQAPCKCRIVMPLSEVQANLTYYHGSRGHTGKSISGVFWAKRRFFSFAVLTAAVMHWLLRRCKSKWLCWLNKSLFTLMALHFHS